MKKTTLFAAVLCTAVASFAQTQVKTKKPSSLYFRVGATYAFPHAGQMSIDQSQFLNGTMNTTTTPTAGSSITSTSWDVKKASLGAGTTASISAGYMINNNIGVELGATIGLSQKKYTFKYEEVYPSGAVTVHESVKGTFYQKTPVLITPSIVIQTGGRKVNVYSRLGLALPVAGKQIWEYEEYAFINLGSVVYSYDWEVKNRFAVGFQGALGAQFRIGGKTKFYVEANGVSLNAYAKKASRTKFAVNGVDQLSNLKTYYNEIDYGFTGVQTKPIANENVPQQAATYSTSYSNIGIGAGFIFQL
jgi:hypothetical protein